MRFIGFFICALGIYLVAAVSAEWNVNDLMTFYDPVTLFGLLFAVAGVTVGTKNFKTLVGGVNGVLSPKYRMTAAQRDETVAFYGLLKSTVTNTSVLFVLISLVLLLLNLDDPAKFGARVGVGLMASLYGVGVNMLFINPAIYSLRRKQTEEAGAEEIPAGKNRQNYQLQSRFNPARLVRDKEAADKLLQLCFEKGITHEEIMDANDIELRRRQK